VESLLVMRSLLLHERIVLAGCQRRRSRRTQAEKLRHFLYEDNYLICAANRDLVIGVVEQQGRVADVVLVKKRADDIFQRWLILENG
jgi:hypothetical protein